MLLNLHKKAIPCFLVTLFAIPICVVVQYFHESYNDLSLFLLAVIILSIFVVTIVFIVPKPPSLDPWLYIFVSMTFSCVVDILLVGETSGFISGWATFNLNRQDYLKTHYGLAINLWDATGHYFLYFSMISAIYRNQSYRHTGLFWVGSIQNCLLVLLSGALSGPFKIQFSILLNFPFFILPFVFLFQTLGRALENRDTFRLSAASRILFATIFIFAAGFCSLRALALSESEIPLVQYYSKTIEPYLLRPSSFYKVQILVYFFYHLPFYLYAAFSLMGSSVQSTFLKDLGVVFAGSVVQGQIATLVPYILGAVEDNTEIPSSESPLMFWGLHGTFVVGLIIFAVLSSRAVTEKGSAIISKKAKRKRY